MIYRQFVSGGGNHSHQYLVACAIDILDSDGKTNAANYLYNYFNEAVAYADWPDVYESDNWTFIGHFWNAYTHVNYLELSSPTAMSRFKYYMGLANTYFDKNNSNNTLAMQYLGKALHYFSDLNASHHVTNLIAELSRHSEWENYADANRTSYRKYSGTLYNNFGTSFEGYGQNAAYNGASYVYSEMGSALIGTTANNWGYGMVEHLDHNYTDDWQRITQSAQGNWTWYESAINKNRPVALRFDLYTNPNTYSDYHFVCGMGIYYEGEETYAGVKDPDGGQYNTGTHYFSWVVNAPDMTMIVPYYSSW